MVTIGASARPAGLLTPDVWIAKSVRETNNEKNFHHVERSFGSFARAFRLPAMVDV